VWSLIQLARPHQYLKNGFVFAPLFFGHKIYILNDAAIVVQAFFSFCFAASAVYVFNDLKDVNEDRNHPVKRNRPIAAGIVLPWQAGILIAVCACASFAIAAYIASSWFFMILVFYMAINLAYSSWLKHIAIMDVSLIATGFVLRIVAGGAVIDLWPSQWLVVITYLLALFLALAKRYDDLRLSEGAGVMRKSLDGYSSEFVAQSMTAMVAVIIVGYILYTLSPEVSLKHHTNMLYLTSVWVVAGLLRYMQITFVEQRSGSPTQTLLKDRPLQGIILAWIGSFYLILYVFSPTAVG
jgi:4-hydroxybenzoate polyprenyltransferase